MPTEAVGKVKPNNIPNVCVRKSDGRSQRPNALLTGRNRSESPANRSKSRPSDPSNDLWQDMASIQQELEKKSGLLKFGMESMKANMDDFVHEALLGHGTCSVVYKMRHRSRPDIVMAVKNMRRSNEDLENKRILMDLHVVTRSSDCPFIVECFGIFLTTSDVWICMEIMPTCLDKLLRDLHRPFPEKVLGKVTYCIITALDYLKKKHNVMHRDVKPSNMLLSYQGIVKLCDFGISGKLKDSIARSRQLGCIGYMAPERLVTQTYDIRADVWSLGISLLELATGSFPYTGTEIEFAIMSKIISDPAPSLPHHIPFTAAFRLFLELCLEKEYHQRPKYSFLMTTEFFCRYATEPHDVLDWLRAIPLPHLQLPKNSGASYRSPNQLTVHFHHPDKLSTSKASSPTSVATLSPDRIRTFIGPLSGSSQDSHDELEVSDGSARALFDVTLVAAPTLSTNYSNSDSVSNPATNIQALSSAPLPSSNQQDAATILYHSNHPGKRADSAVANPSRVAAVKCTEEPNSQASSGYGSSGSPDSSPGAFAGDNRFQSDPVIGPRLYPGKSTKNPNPPLSSPTASQWYRAPSPRQEILPPNSSPTSRAAPTNVTVTGTNIVAPLVQVFERVSLSPSTWRDGHQPAQHAHAPRRDASSASQTRSASANTRLHRSHAQRWPSSHSPAVRKKSEDSRDAVPMADLRRRPPLADSAGSCCCGADSRAGTAAQKYHHCLYNNDSGPGVCVKRSGGSLGFRTMTPPLTGQTSGFCGSLPRLDLTKQKHPCQSNGCCGDKLTPAATICPRLMHRLNSHPPPRQTTTVFPRGSVADRPHHHHHQQPATDTPTSRSNLPPPASGGQQQVCVTNVGPRRSVHHKPVANGRDENLANGNLRTAVSAARPSMLPIPTGSTPRSASKPPVSHSWRRPLETEL